MTMPRVPWHLEPVAQLAPVVAHLLYEPQGDHLCVELDGRVHLEEHAAAPPNRAQGHLAAPKG